MEAGAAGEREHGPFRPRPAGVARLDAPRPLAGWMHEATTTRRLFVLLPFMMIFGLVLYAALPGEPERWALMLAGLVPLGLLVVLRHSGLLAWGGLVLALWFGFCLLPLHGHWFGTQMLYRPAYGLFEARVDEVLSATPEARRLIISQLQPGEGTRAVPILRARLLAPPEPPLAPGDIIRANMRFAPVPGPVLPGTYDGQFHSYFAGIGAYGNVTSGFEHVRHGPELDFTRRIEITRMAIGERINAVLDGTAAAAIGRAMVMGDQSGITDETRAVMAASGLAHVYSISGLHLSIVAGGIFFLLRLALAAIPATANRWRVKKIAAIGGLAAAFFYLLLAGGLANVPALRSTLMLGLVFGAVLAGRRALTMRNVALAAIAIVIIDPASIFRPSFQLSFAAVIALIGIYEMPRPVRIRQAGFAERVWRTIWATALTSFIAGAATLLFSAYHFQQTAPLGVLGNVLALPVVSLVIMPFAVLSVLAMPFGVEAPFIIVMGWGIERMMDVAELVAAWSTGWIGNPLLTGWALLIGLGALGLFAAMTSRARLLAPALAIPLVLVFGLDQRPDLLIADTTQAVALREATGLALVTGRPGSFAVDAWAQHYQEPIAEKADSARCDSLACVAKTGDYSVSIIRNGAAFAEDCGRHDLIIARIRAPVTCTGSQIVDGEALAALGVHWLRWDGRAGRFDIRTAIPDLNRPWRVGQR